MIIRALPLRSPPPRSLTLTHLSPSSAPNKDPFYTSLPVEVQSGTFTDAATGEAYKQSTWTYHVPTALQAQVMERARSGLAVALETETDGESDDDVEYVKDYQSQLGDENINIMASVKAGALRGEKTQFDAALMREFEEKERRSYRYKIQPARVVAQTDVVGEATPEKIAAALRAIKTAVTTEGRRALGREVRMRSRDLNSTTAATAATATATGAAVGDDGQPLLGLQLWGCKACFNMQGEPAMAVYEMQYGYRRTTVMVELENV